jgi:hypothetical protein
VELPPLPWCAPDSSSAGPATRCAAAIPIARTLSQPALTGTGIVTLTGTLKQSPISLPQSVAGAATPALAGLASDRWIKGVRRELALWRNAIGLASIVVISAFWVFQMTRWLLLLMNRELTAPYGDWREHEQLNSSSQHSSCIRRYFWCSKGVCPATDDCCLGTMLFTGSIPDNISPTG